jgi:PAS domain S-box-containing protein
MIQRTKTKERLLKENLRLQQKISKLESANAKYKEIETRHKIEHSFISSILETIGALVVVLDTQGRIIQYNKSCELITGYSFAEMRGKHFWDYLLIPEEIESVKNLFADMKAGHFPNVHENYWVDRSGNRRLISWSNTVITDSTGKPEFIIGTGIDITDRTQWEMALTSSEEKYRRLYGNILEGFVHTNMEGLILEVNNSYLEMLGYTKKEISRLRYQDITPQKWHEFETDIVEQQILPKGHSALYEKEYIKKDGTIFPVESQTYLIKDNNGKPTGMWAFVRDITERKRIEEALQESEERLTALLNASDQPIMLLDINGKVLAGNVAVLKRLGLSLDEFIGKNAYQFLPQELAFKRKQMMEGVIHSRAAVRFEDQREDTFFDNIIYPVFNNQGNVTGVAIFVNDITENKRAEKLLRDSESQLRQVVDLVPHFIFAKNRQGQFILVNQAVADAYGTTVEKLIGKTDADFNPNKDEVKHFLRDDNEVMDSGQRKDIAEEIITDSAGRVRYLHTIKIPYHITTTMEDAILGVSIDITERKVIESALRESEEQFRNLAEESPNMIFINHNGKIVYANNKCKDIMGYSRDELLSSSFDFRKLIAPASLGLIQDSFKMHLSGKEVAPYEYTLTTKEGKYLQAIITTKLINHFGQNAILGIVTDITELKRVEEQIKQSEERFRSLFQNSLDIITIHDEKTILRHCTPSIEKILGYRPEELLGKDPIDYIHPDDRTLVGKELENVIQRISDGKPTQYRFRHADGTWRWLESVANNQLDNPNIKGNILSSRDVTESKKAKEQLELLNKQFRALAANTQRVREEESARIAREIHDELGQILTGIKNGFIFYRR